MQVRASFIVLVAASIPLTFSGCGSISSNTQPPPPSTYEIGGTVSGLSGTGLILQDNGGDNLSISSNGSFSFSAAVASGSAYAVTVYSEPANPAQVCTVTNGSGMAMANVTNVGVTCQTTGTATGQWTWAGGNGSANYGTLGQSAPGNLPPARTFASSWTDSSGDQWFFGGNSSWISLNLWLCGQPVPASYSDFNDFWKYSGGEWTWMGGSQTATATQPGVYGTQQQPSSSNIPGARHGAVTWTDGAGNLWLFGGFGIDSAGNQGDLNDLWENVNGEWTWIAGSNVVNQSGNYGAQGTPAAANSPGARDGAAGWTDAQGSLWLFGGYGYDSTTNTCYGQIQPAGYLNDLWRFANGQWTWMGGANLANQSGSYGTQGVASPANMPASRQNATAWSDASGNFWLFGGDWQVSISYTEAFNDLWRYANGKWTWVAGSSTPNQPGVYGTLGIPAASNAPGSRIAAAGWTDVSGNLWLFGGDGFDEFGRGGPLNDLWRFSGGEWTWVGGAEVRNNSGSYGTLGVPAPTNLPPSRAGASAWTEKDGTFWMFGGGYNDLWEYQP